MTKEDIRNFEINARNILEKQGAIGFNIFINEFFSQNICIPKGTNRHPYADVLHEWLENRIGILQLRYSGAKEWGDDEDLTFDLIEYRIKPSEPIYECMYYDSDGKTDWLTDDEYKLMMESEPIECYRANETRRIRE